MIESHEVEHSGVDVVDVFRIDACDITYEALELFFVSLNQP